MVVRRRAATWQRRLLVATLACGMIAYFVWHAFHGNYGIHAKQALEIRAGELEAELAEARAERQAMERRVALLKSQSIDPDILEERARESLSLAHPNDIVILRRADPPPRAETPAPAAQPRQARPEPRQRP
jgi:cell division protein FtsB